MTRMKNIAFLSLSILFRYDKIAPGMLTSHQLQYGYLKLIFYWCTLADSVKMMCMLVIVSCRDEAAKQYSFIHREGYFDISGFVLPCQSYNVLVHSELQMEKAWQSPNLLLWAGTHSSLCKHSLKKRCCSDLAQVLELIANMLYSQSKDN